METSYIETPMGFGRRLELKFEPKLKVHPSARVLYLRRVAKLSPSYTETPMEFGRRLELKFEPH